MSKEMKFPFEPNEKVKAAFRQFAAMQRAIQIMTEALLVTATEQIIDPWCTVKSEHPELDLHEDHLFYSRPLEMIDIKPKKKS